MQHPREVEVSDLRLDRAGSRRFCFDDQVSEVVRGSCQCKQSTFGIDSIDFEELNDQS